MNETTYGIRTVTDIHELASTCLEMRDPEPLEACMRVVRDWLVPENERMALLSMLEGMICIIEDAGVY